MSKKPFFSADFRVRAFVMKFRHQFVSISQFFEISNTPTNIEISMRAVQFSPQEPNQAAQLDHPHFPQRDNTCSLFQDGSMRVVQFSSQGENQVGDKPKPNRKCD